MLATDSYFPSFVHEHAGRLGLSVRERQIEDWIGVNPRIELGYGDSRSTSAVVRSVRSGGAEVIARSPP